MPSSAPIADPHRPAISRDEITGDSAANVLKGNGGGDTVRGGDNNDALKGDAGNDDLFGDDGNDTINGGANGDAIDGGGGVDTATYAEKSVGVSVTLNGATAATVMVNGVAEDTIKNVENLTGGSAADSFLGDAFANVFSGDAGNDSLSGLLGNDNVSGGAGDDTRGNINTTRGDGSCDTSGGVRIRFDVPATTTIWNDAENACPDTDGMLDGSDTPVAAFDNIFSFTTSSANADFTELNGDACAFALERDRLCNASAAAGHRGRHPRDRTE